METDQFLMELLRGLSSNTQAITELRRVIDQLPVRSEFKDSEVLCSRVDLNVDDIKEVIGKVSARLDKIDSWQKIKLPFIIGTITLVLYAIGFFFTLHEVTSMIDVKHTMPTQAVPQVSTPQSFTQ